jgi:hypothetical protein
LTRLARCDRIAPVVAENSDRFNKKNAGKLLVKVSEKIDSGI